MPSNSFFELSNKERGEVLDIIAPQTHREPFYLEKDIWIVWVLNVLFSSSLKQDLVFKGGTSLSKAYNIIDRFSEDVDITYDIRAIAHDLVAETGVIPKTRSQASRWTKEIRQRLAECVSNKVKPILQHALQQEQEDAEVKVDDGVLKIEYASATENFSEYINPVVLLEFGARSTGEPTNDIKIICDADISFPGLVLPKATARVMTAERTFWEKTTAVHVLCVGGPVRGRKNFSRHLYDLYRLEKTGYADRAIRDRKLASSVADNKSMFFREKDRNGNLIDYHQAVKLRSLCLVPDQATREIVEADYNAMVKAEMLYSDVPTFNDLIDKLAEIEKRANSI